jgi:hypothetical protein
MATLPGESLLNTVASGNTLLNANLPGTNIQATAGWYVAIGCTGAILLASTPVAPVVLAVMTIALLFQLENLIQGS